MSLTDVAIRNAKPGEKTYKLFDGGGLHLVVSPNGSRLWRLAYRFGGKPKQLSFGPYPLTKLADARRLRDEAKRHLQSGRDPSIERRKEKLRREETTATTFWEVTKEVLERAKNKGRAERTRDNFQRALKKHCSVLHKLPISEITPVDVLSVLQRLETEGKLRTAQIVRQAIRVVFARAISTARATTDPTAALRDAIDCPKVTHYAALTDEDEFGDLLRKIDDYSGIAQTRLALRFLALTMTRKTETLGARWREIEMDAATWTIPPERTKMRREHVVPLSPQALNVLRVLQQIVSDSEYVFPGYTGKPLSDETLNKALRRMGYKSDQMTPHGFRSSASTILNERKYNPDIIEVALAHLDPNPIRRIYNRAEYWPERVALFNDWANIVDELRERSRRRSVE